MRPNISLAWSLAILGIVLVACSLMIVLSISAIESHPLQIIIADVLVPPVQSITLPAQVIAGIPVRLTIPKINVDAAIEYVGLTSLGAMAVPKGPDDVGWFELGPRPGDIGSAVIAGHEGWKDGIPAVFDDLNKLAVGDDVYVKDDTGTTTAFVVRRIMTFGENDDATEVFDSSDGLAHLNLITCEGIWNAATQSYSGRLVIFADKL